MPAFTGVRFVTGSISASRGITARATSCRNHGAGTQTRRQSQTDRTRGECRRAAGWNPPPTRIVIEGDSDDYVASITEINKEVTMERRRLLAIMGAVMLVPAFAGIAHSADQLQTRDRLRDPDQDKDQIRDRDRLHQTDTLQVETPDRDQLRDQLRDQDQTRDRLHKK
jgi:hypothetical protein